MTSFLSLPRSMIAVVLFLVLPATVLADPATVPFVDCFDDESDVGQKFTVNTVYAQASRNEEWGNYLNLTVIGDSPQQIVGRDNASMNLSTLFTTTSVLTLDAWSNSSYLCSPLRPPSPLPLPPLDSIDGTYCPMAAGPFAFSSTIPWGDKRALTTLNTRLRAVDPFGRELVCLDVFNTPLSPSLNSPYGQAKIIFWSTVALALAYYVMVGIARIASAWGRGISRRGVWARAQSAGFILASAISGERFATSPALMRFSTPSMRDVIFHTQWCAVLAMVAVEWPQFVYPLLTQTAWSTLVYNVTLIHSSTFHRWNPLSTAPFDPPQNFSDQISDPTSPLFIDPTIPNILFTLPPNATNGISSFAYTIGIRPMDLFPTCIIIFLGIIAATVVLSLIVWSIDHVATFIGNGLGHSGHNGYASSRLTGTRSPILGKELQDTSISTTAPTDEGNISLGTTKFQPGRFALPMGSVGTSGTVDRGINSHRAWWRFRSDIGSFHRSVLHGNLVRILVLFHLPLTVFSCYHMTLLRSEASKTSIALAGLSFTVFSLLIPAHLVIRVTFTTTNKLYDETRTLLSLGPLYNHYRHGSQMFASLLFATNIAFGVTIGAGQKSGTAQAIIILVVEVASALVTSIWLPWGSGASMGLISFLFCVARIVIAVLLVILTPTISIGPGAGGWVAYGILIILALVYLALLLMLLVKIVEAGVRIIGGIDFDRSKHVVDSGLIGACGLLGCCGSRKRRRTRANTRSKNHKYEAADAPPTLHHRDSDLSSYIPPNTPGTMPPFLATESRKGSTHSGPPPSVLKPEYANRPYREDSEDEGFIMGAWQPFPRTGYAPVTDGPQTHAPVPFQAKHSAAPPQTSSGFSRVGGGRAHIDAPYAITSSGSTHTFPSIGQQGSQTALAPLPNFDDYDDDPPPSVSNVAREYGSLPPGAMLPAHVRTKSQSAIVEDAGALYLGVGRLHQPRQPSQGSSTNTSMIGANIASGSRPLSKFMVGSATDDEDEGQPKKKPWYHLRRSRHQSIDGGPEDFSPTKPIDPELGGLGAAEAASAQPQRSFVVIRKPQQQSSVRHQSMSQPPST